VGNYLCQRINEFCTQAQLRCRLHVGELPRDIEISSQTRHNISMAVQEAVHNVIKHAHASQITAHVTFSDMVLTVSVEDDGSGFHPEQAYLGHGWSNMKRRLAEVGGSCLVESSSGQGTRVLMRLRIHPLVQSGRAKDSALAPAASAESQSTDA
jgi:signal transduction histidine kinase